MLRTIKLRTKFLKKTKKRLKKLKARPGEEQKNRSNLDSFLIIPELKCGNQAHQQINYICKRQ
jgi:hypothetical protein